MILDLPDEAADPAQEWALRSAAAPSADRAAVPLVFPRFEPDAHGSSV